MLIFARAEESYVFLRDEQEGEALSNVWCPCSGPRDADYGKITGYYFVSGPEVQEKVEISNKSSQSPHRDHLYKAEDRSPVAALWEMVFPNHFHF